MVCKYCYAENADVFIGITPRNNTFFEYENYIHRKFYPYIIHPYSRFRVYWEGYFTVHIVVRLTIICIIWGLLNHKNFIYQSIILSFQVINALDLIVKFFTGYVEPTTGLVVLEFKKIATRYFKTLFIFDLIPAIPFDLIFYYTKQFNVSPRTGYWLCAPTSFLFSLPRCATFINYMINLSKVLLWDRLLIGLIIISVIMYLSTLFLANFYLCEVENFYNKTVAFEMNGIVAKTPVLNVYFDTLFLVILDCLFFDTHFHIENDLIRCLDLILTFLGTAFFTAFFINYLIMGMKNHEKSFAVKTRVETFVTIKHFNPSLKNKTFLYFQILLSNRYTKDDEIFNHIPDTFKGDIFYHLCLPLLKNFHGFEDLPTFVLRRLAESMKYQLYLPNEVVMSKEEPTLRMYFILRGTVALYSNKGFELYHFEGGSNFNGKNFVMGEQAHNYAISVEVTELYVLHRDEFLDIMSGFPLLFQKLEGKLLQSRKDSSYFM